MEFFVEKMDFFSNMKNAKETDLESEIREWMLEQGGSMIHESIDLFNFAATGRGFVAKR